MFANFVCFGSVFFLPLVMCGDAKQFKYFCPVKEKLPIIMPREVNVPELFFKVVQVVLSLAFCYSHEVPEA